MCMARVYVKFGLSTIFQHDKAGDIYWDLVGQTKSVFTVPLQDNIFSRPTELNCDRLARKGQNTIHCRIENL